MPSTFTAELVLVRCSAHDESHASRSHHLPCRRNLGGRAGGARCWPTAGGTSKAAILSLFLTVDRRWRPLLRYLFRRSPPFTVPHAIFSWSCRRDCSTRCCPPCECVLECRVFFAGAICARASLASSLTLSSSQLWSSPLPSSIHSARSYLPAMTAISCTRRGGGIICGDSISPAPNPPGEADRRRTAPPR